MSTEQSESAPAAVTAPQVETKATPAADVTQQRRLGLQKRSAKKTPSVWLLAKRRLKERGWHGSNRRKMPMLIGLSRRIRRKPPQQPQSQPRIQKKKAQRAAAFLASAPTNGLVLAA